MFDELTPPSLRGSREKESEEKKKGIRRGKRKTKRTKKATRVNMTFLKTSRNLTPKIDGNSDGDGIFYDF